MPAPGQRAAQLPETAAPAAQRALARAAIGAGHTAGVLRLRLPSGWWLVTHDADGRQWWTNDETGARCEGAPCNDTREREG